MSFITGIKITEVIEDFLKWLHVTIRGSTAEHRKRSDVKFARMTLEERRSNPAFRHTMFLQSLILDLNLSAYKITTEGLSIVIVLISGALSTLFFAISKSVLLFVMYTVLFYCGILALMYLLSRLGAQQRKRDIFFTQDLLASTITDGVISSIKGNMSLYPESIKPIMLKIIGNVERLNETVTQALNNLEYEFYPHFTRFCQSAKVYEAKHTKGFERVFSILINNNFKETIRDSKLQRTSSKINSDFMASIALMIAFGLYVSQYPSASQFYRSAWGQALLAFQFATVIGGFIAVQYILALPYNNKGGK